MYVVIVKYNGKFDAFSCNTKRYEEVKKMCGQWDEICILTLEGICLERWVKV
jgi:hypothetical protein